MTAADYRAIGDSDVAATESDCAGLYAINVYWLGKTLTAQRGDLLDSVNGMDAGYEQEFQAPIIVRQSQFTTLGIRQPKAEEIFEIDNPDATDKERPRITLAIKTVQPSQDAVNVTWTVKASN